MPLFLSAVKNFLQLGIFNWLMHLVDTLRGLPLLFIYTPEVNSQFLEELSSPILYWLNFASQWVVKLKQTVCGRFKANEVHLFQALLGNLFPLIKCSGSSICLAGTLCALCHPGPSMYLPTSWELGPIQAPSTAWCPCPLLGCAAADLPGRQSSGISTKKCPFSKHGYFCCAEVSNFRTGNENLPSHVI